jgi:hypothetical protein
MKLIVIMILSATTISVFGQVDTAHSGKVTPPDNGINHNRSQDRISHPVRKSIPKKDTNNRNNGNSEKYPYKSHTDSLK